MLIFLFLTSYFDSCQPKGGNSGCFDVRLGKNEGCDARIFEAAARKSTHTPRTSSRCLCFRLYLARNAGNFRCRYSRLSPGYVEFYRLCKELVVYHGFLTTRCCFLPTNTTNKLRSINSFHTKRDVGWFWSSVNCKLVNLRRIFKLIMEAISWSFFHRTKFFKLFLELIIIVHCFL